MPAAGLLALLDDITMIMDDVAVLSKVAAKKTAGIAGDDLAVNAEGLVGIQPDRELPIIGKVALGSIANKFVLVPLALILPSAAITPLLMCGGAFLCYEGVHKVTHKEDEEDKAHHEKMVEAIQAGPEDLARLESEKVKSAIVTDIVLSAEIVAVALGAVAEADTRTKALVLSVVAGGMTIGIYGLVALIVKVDDFGLYLQRKNAPGSALHSFGGWLLRVMPKVMRAISVIGTIAMFLVGGGIFMHALHFDQKLEQALEAAMPGSLLVGLLSTAATLTVGALVGVAVVAVVAGVQKVIAALRRK
jgi:predicted DNA repair protein MutK